LIYNPWIFIYLVTSLQLDQQFTPGVHPRISLMAPSTLTSKSQKRGHPTTKGNKLTEKFMEMAPKRRRVLEDISNNIGNAIRVSQKPQAFERPKQAFNSQEIEEESGDEELSSINLDSEGDHHDDEQSDDDDISQVPATHKLILSG
jgi:hypothetical protein